MVMHHLLLTGGSAVVCFMNHRVIAIDKCFITAILVVQYFVEVTQSVLSFIRVSRNHCKPSWSVLVDHF